MAKSLAACPFSLFGSTHLHLLGCPVPVQSIARRKSLLTHKHTTVVHCSNNFQQELVSWFHKGMGKLNGTQTPSANHEISEVGPIDVPQDRLPQHVAIIMDGNGRWAAHRGLAVMYGHDQGVKALKDVVQCCGTWGIPYLTVYAFSTENWNRQPAEVQFLFNLMERVLTQELEQLAGNKVRLRFIGDWSRLPQSLQNAMCRAEHETQNNDGLHLNIAISYSGRTDMATAMRSIASKVANGTLAPEQVTEDLISSHLSTSVLPSSVRSPDLLIRTSGEQRLSNFMLWEAAYSELYFSPVYWPEFGEQQLREAVQEYASRQRRYGRRPNPQPAAEPSQIVPNDNALPHKSPATSQPPQVSTQQEDAAQQSNGIAAHLAGMGHHVEGLAIGNGLANCVQDGHGAHEGPREPLGGIPDPLSDREDGANGLHRTAQHDGDAQQHVLGDLAALAPFESCRVSQSVDGLAGLAFRRGSEPVVDGLLTALDH